MNIVHNNERKSDKHYPVPSIHRAFILLETLAENPSGLGVSDLARLSGWPKSSVYNILATLAADGYVTQDPESGRYRMSIKLVSLVGAVLERFDLRGLAHPLLMELVEKTGETVNLGILDGTEAIYLETIAGPGAIRVNTWPGKRLPIHRTALGKALAAELPQTELPAIIAKTGLPRSTPNTHTTLKSLQADLELTRQRGYAIDDEEDEVGLRCIGAPIRDHKGETIAAVSVTGLAQRVPIATMPELAIAVMDAARRISDLLGYSDKPGLSKAEVLNATR